MNKIRSAKDYLYLFFTGICMGSADVVPGVSGGTMAFIMGIYEELLDAIKSINIKFFQLLIKFKIKEIFNHVPWKFLLVLGVGILGAIASLSHVITHALEHHEARLYAFFFGLVVASIIALLTTVKWRPAVFASLIAGTVIAWFIVGLVPAEMPHTSLYLFGSGFIAIMAMILPGISGSFILLIIGQYEYIIGAVKDLNLGVIATVGAGAVIGIMGFSRFLSWLLAKSHNITVATLIGFMVGSLRKIWPFKGEPLVSHDHDGEVTKFAEQLVLPDFSSRETLIAFGLAILGFIVVTVIDHSQTKTNPVVRLFKKN